MNLFLKLLSSCIFSLFPNIRSHSHMFYSLPPCVPLFACLVYHKVEILGFSVILNFCNFLGAKYDVCFFLSLRQLDRHPVSSVRDKWGGFHEWESQRRWCHLSVSLRNVQTFKKCSDMCFLFNTLLNFQCCCFFVFLFLASVMIISDV